VVNITIARQLTPDDSERVTFLNLHFSGCPSYPTSVSPARQPIAPRPPWSPTVLYHWHLQLHRVYARTYSEEREDGNRCLDLSANALGRDTCRPALPLRVARPSPHLPSALEKGGLVRAHTNFLEPLLSKTEESLPLSKRRSEETGSACHPLSSALLRSPKFMRRLLLRCP
jgi:hypothetical protein